MGAGSINMKPIGILKMLLNNQNLKEVFLMNIFVKQLLIATKPHTETEGYTYSIIFTPKQKYPHIT